MARGPRGAGPNAAASALRPALHSRTKFGFSCSDLSELVPLVKKQSRKYKALAVLYSILLEILIMHH